MDDYVRPDVYIALKMPSGLHKIIQLKPNQSISLGKFGSFSSDQLLGRPFYHTYEIVGADEKAQLRVVPASELVEQDNVPEADLSGQQAVQDNENATAEFEIVDQAGKVLMRTNQDILDDAGTQKLTTADIEELKKAEAASGRDIIAKIMASHSELDKKTAFSLAKYTTRKASKYMRRFVPLPIDVTFLAKWWLAEKDPPRIMDIREEMLALVMTWSNVHFTQDLSQVLPDMSAGRWLVVDDTGGLIVAAMAERMGILHPDGEEAEEEKDLMPSQTESSTTTNEKQTSAESGNMRRAGSAPQVTSSASQAILAQETHMTATHNTIHVIHPNAQPNLSFLTYFNYDIVNSSPAHPLHRHLKALSWVQLVQPEADPLYAEPEEATEQEIAGWKSNKRGTYYRKRRRWQKTRSVVDEARAGGFDGLIVSSPMTPSSPLRYLVPLLRGGASVVVYSPNIEPLAELSDNYSSARKSAWLGMSGQERTAALKEGEAGDFPVDPTLLLSPCIYTARARDWQVLPGRTHPLMTSRGGPQGYVFTATRVIPLEGEKVEARGTAKRRKVTKDSAVDVSSTKAEESSGTTDTPE